MTTYDLGRGLTLDRTLLAPRALVFQSWTDPAKLGWYFSGLPGEVVQPEVDLRVGGYWRQKMIVGENEEYFSGGMYLEIVPVERLVYLWGATDGWPKLDPDNLDDSLRVTITLEDRGDETTSMTFVVAIPDHFTDAQAAEWTASGMRDGWSMTIDRLVDSFATTV
jgi:uncharacterized protein YndB with AHSA1/START domain